LVWAGGLINKIYIPKSVFVVSAILVGLVNLVLALVPLSLIMLVTGLRFSLALLFLPVPILITLVFALGVGFAVSTLAVFFVDVIDIYQVALTILMYLTPLFYPLNIVPAKYLFFIHINPMYYFVEIFRQPIYQGTIPELSLLLRASLIALTILLLAWWFFTSKSNEFAYRV
jgi:ABC-type polysaccharide/polyol phosphate export permease